jgi:acyl-CoA reductase-like NAD-dependent aldehyde dehydrogenase
MQIAVFHLKEKLAEAQATRAAAEAELAELPAGQRLAFLWRIDGEIDELEQALITLEASIDPVRAFTQGERDGWLPGLEPCH